MTSLKVLHLAKRYGDREVVKDVSLEVETGEIVGLLGPNGAGKTTSFYMIVGLIQSDKGQILIGDDDVTLDPMDLRAKKGLGYLPQELSIFRKLSVADNIMAVLEFRKDLNRKERKATLNSLLEEFNISHLHSSYGISLSGGEQRRVEIARTLAANPKFILLDEPFAGVDPISVGDIKKIIVQLKEKGIGVLITDHSVRETLDVCERAYIVSHGNLIASGLPEDVIENKEVRSVYLGEQFQL